MIIELWDEEKNTHMPNLGEWATSTSEKVKIKFRKKKFQKRTILYQQTTETGMLFFLLHSMLHNFATCSPDEICASCNKFSYT